MYSSCGKWARFQASSSGASLLVAISSPRWLAQSFSCDIATPVALRASLFAASNPEICQSSMSGDYSLSVACSKRTRVRSF